MGCNYLKYLTKEFDQFADSFEGRGYKIVQQRHDKDRGIVVVRYWKNVVYGNAGIFTVRGQGFRGKELGNFDLVGISRYLDMLQHYERSIFS